MRQNALGRSTDSLRNVLQLERKFQFSDRAVIGGLDRFIERVATSLPWIRDVEPLAGTSYAALEPGQRHSWASAVAAIITEASEQTQHSKDESPADESKSRQVGIGNGC